MGGIEKIGRDCFNDPDHVHLYGLPPKTWYERGIRILARTCLESVKDPLGNKIGGDIAEIVLPAVGNRAISIRSQGRVIVSTQFSAICRAPKASVLRRSPSFSI